jgi:hypothetical protein
MKIPRPLGNAQWRATAMEGGITMIAGAQSKREGQVREILAD